MAERNNSSSDDTEDGGLSREESSGVLEINLDDRQESPVERSIYNNYKKTLLTIIHSLSSHNIVKLKKWATKYFHNDCPQRGADIIWKLDSTRVISSSNLEPLQAFLGRIMRNDLVHLIDSFLEGNYHLPNSINLRDLVRNSEASTSNATAQVDMRARRRSGMNRQSARKTAETSRDKLRWNHQTDPFSSPDAKKDSNNHLKSLPMNQRNYPPERQTKNALDTAGNYGQRFGSNSNKLSKPPRPNPSADQNPDGDGSRWPCSHFKRRCHVKFSCCDRYWPCHHCHNNRSHCDEKNLRPRDAKFIKCGNCGAEQEFGERSQYCSNCRTEFARFFCSECKLLTDTEDDRYHCKKCGTCLTHRDRIFHCDICGVCCDVQLTENHKCRTPSSYDPCCICLEDAFTGFQILPCSHRVHKECLTQMIRKRIFRCPICGESFAYSLRIPEL